MKPKEDKVRLSDKDLNPEELKSSISNLKSSDNYRIIFAEESVSVSDQ